MTENEVKEIVSKTVDETLAKMGRLRVRFIIIGFIISGAIALLVLGVKTAIGIK